MDCTILVEHPKHDTHTQNVQRNTQSEKCLSSRKKKSNMSDKTKQFVFKKDADEDGSETTVNAFTNEDFSDSEFDLERHCTDTQMGNE